MDIPSGDSVARFDYHLESVADRAEIAALDRAWEIRGRVVGVALPGSGTYLVFRDLSAAHEYLELLARELGHERDGDQLDLTPPGATFRSAAYVIPADRIPPAALRTPGVRVYPYRVPAEQDQARTEAFTCAAERGGQVVACHLVACGGFAVTADLAAAQCYLDLLVQRLGGVRRDERSAVLPQPGFAPQIRILGEAGEARRAVSVMLRIVGGVGPR